MRYLLLALGLSLVGCGDASSRDSVAPSTPQWTEEQTASKKAVCYENLLPQIEDSEYADNAEVVTEKTCACVIAYVAAKYEYEYAEKNKSEVNAYLEQDNGPSAKCLSKAVAND